jgi:hypothetical protein
MNATLALSENLVETYALRPARRTDLERVVLTLVVLGMLASLVTFISYQQAMKYQLKSDELYSSNIVKPQLYYIAHAIEIALLLPAGLLAMILTDWRVIERGYLARFALLLGAVVLMTMRGYSLSDLLSTKLTDISGPCPFLLSMLVFIGARRRNWSLLGPAMVVVAVVFSVLTLVSIAGLRTFTRQEGVASLSLILNVLYWPASWIALKDYPQHSFARRLRFGPTVIYGFGSLFTQTRLLFVMLFALFVVYAYGQRRRKIPQATAWIAGLVLTVWAGLFAAVFLKDTQAFEKVESVVDAFSSRLDEDTRTGQLMSFQKSVKLHELVLGRGSFATWNWGGLEWHGGTDVGYLTLLLYGGVPLLTTYVATHMKPSLAVFRNKRATWQFASAGVVLLWWFHLFSSGYPAVELQYYLILFCTGACISREPSEQLSFPHRGNPNPRVSYVFQPQILEGVFPSLSDSRHPERTKSDHLDP